MLKVVALYLSMSIVVVKTSSACPDNCTCTREKHFIWTPTYDKSDLLFVTCQPDPLLPDLTPLKGNTSEKVLVVSGKTEDGIVALKKESFPRGLKITELLFHHINTITIDDDAFENLQYSLLRLDLSYTGLKPRGPLTFLTGLIHLDILNLNSNYQFWAKREHDDLKSVFRNTGLEKLRVLKMSTCYVYEMAIDAFVGLQSLEELYMGNNRLSRVPHNLRLLPNLEILDLSENKIKTLKGSLFKNNRKLKRLLLAGNPDLEIKYDAFIGLENSLITLDLEGTGQSSVPTVALSRLKMLKYLNMSDNAINEMETGCFQGEYCLQELVLEKVVTQMSQTVFEGQTSCIKILSISGMDGSFVPTKALASLDKLEYIKYAHNHEMTVLREGSFAGVKATTISLEDLYISFIEEGAFDGVHVPLSLYLNSLAISNISFVLDYPKGTFKVLSIEDVPVPCNCTLVEPVEHLQCALTGKCKGEYPYYYVDEQSLREKLSTTCPNASDFRQMYLKCDTSTSTSGQPASEHSVIILSGAAFITGLLYI